MGRLDLGNVWLRTFIGAASALLATSCGSPPSLPANFEFPNREAQATPNISQSVILLSDNQDNYLFGESFFLRSSVADAFSGTAIRPPQLDLYGQEFLAWTLQNQCPNAVNCRPIIHLGDAANMSCTNEIDRFFETMKAARLGWVVAPGNHDGYFNGTDLPPSGDVGFFGLSQQVWDATCAPDGKRMDKSEFTRRYLAAKGATIPSLLAQVKKTSGTWRSTEGATYPAAATWHIDLEPQRSFIVQRIDFTTPKKTNGPLPAAESDGDRRLATGILIDTNQYDAPPTSTPGGVDAGSTGDLREDQMEAIRALVAQVPAERRQLVVFGHHRFQDMTPRAKAFLQTLRAEENVLLYVSSHSHAGEYIVNEGSEKRRDLWLELNIGSILDWPPEFREFHLSCNDEACSRVSMRAQLYRLSDMWSGSEGTNAAPECSPSPADSSDGPRARVWEPQKGDLDFFARYKKAPCANIVDGQEPMSVCLSDMILSSLLRLIREVPSTCATPSGALCDAAQVDLAEKALALTGTSHQIAKAKRVAARALDAYERSPLRLTAMTDGDRLLRRDFRLCQALWASKYETHGRKPSPEDWLITLPNGAK